MARVLLLSSSLYGCGTRTAGLKATGQCGAPTFCRLKAQEQNVWQDRSFRFRIEQRSQRRPHDRVDEACAAHSSPRASECVQNAQGHRGQDSSQALRHAISPLDSSRTSKVEPFSQTARVGALERKNFFQSKPQWTFCVIVKTKNTTVVTRLPPTSGLRLNSGPLHGLLVHQNSTPCWKWVP